jgi:hypothetical protein
VSKRKTPTTCANPVCRASIEPDADNSVEMAQVHPQPSGWALRDRWTFCDPRCLHQYLSLLVVGWSRTSDDRVEAER